MSNFLDRKLAPQGGAENDGCDYVFDRPLRPGSYWVHLPECPQERFAVRILGDDVTDGSPVVSGHPNWPTSIRTIADTKERVMWFLFPEQYLTAPKTEAAEQITAKLIQKLYKDAEATAERRRNQK